MSLKQRILLKIIRIIYPRYHPNKYKFINYIFGKQKTKVW